MQYYNNYPSLTSNSTSVEGILKNKITFIFSEIIFNIYIYIYYK